VSGWAESGSVITFRSKTLYKFLPDESPRSDSEMVVVPNLVMMTGMLKPEVQAQMSFVKKQVSILRVSASDEKSSGNFFPLDIWTKIYFKLGTKIPFDIEVLD
jgi:hypothetical protein